MPYVNIPHLQANLVDGNLRNIVRNNDPISLIIGRAPSGQTNSLYQVADSGQASAEFGGASDIVRGIVEAESGGASNIFAIRVPGRAPFLEGLGAESWDNTHATTPGIDILPTLESSEAGSKYGLAFRSAQSIDRLGAAGVATGMESVGELMIVDLEDDTVVHRSDLVVSSYVDVDLGLMDVERGAIDANAVAPGTAEVMTFRFETIADGTAGPSSAGAPAGSEAAGTNWTVPICGVNVKIEEITGDDPEDLGAKLAAAAAAIPALNDVFTIADASALGVGIVTFTADKGTDLDSILRYTSEHVTTAAAQILQAAPATFQDDSAYLPIATSFEDYTARPYVSGDVTLENAVTGAAVAFDAATEIQVDYNVRARDIGHFPSDPDAPFAPTGGGVFIPLEDVIAEYTTQLQYDEDIFDPGGPANFLPGDLFCEFYAGETGEDTSYMQLYEQIHQVLEFLQFTDFDIVLPQGILLDAPNVGDGDTTSAGMAFLGELDETAIEALTPVVLTGAVVDALDDETIDGTPVNTGDFVVFNTTTGNWELGDARAYPVAGGADDVLGELAIVETADFDYVYYWDTDGDGVANISSSGEFSDAAATPGGLLYREVNFAHQLAKFCYDASTDYQMCHGIVPLSLPASLGPRTLAKYWGKLPTYTYDAGLEKDLVASADDEGSGILGHKLIGGNSTYRSGEKNGGIMLTTSGWFNDGAEETDANNALIDLGKYISICGIFGRTSNAFNNSTAGYLTNGSNIYGGFISSLPPDIAPTAQRMPAIRMDYFMGADKADDIAGARVVTLFSESGAPTIADAPTAALLSSDYTRLMTYRIVASIVEACRTASRPFFGKGQTTLRRQALQAAIGGVMQDNLGADKPLDSASFQLTQTRAQKVAGEASLTLVLGVVNELRKITATISLTA
jgi:hypothetical protein